LPTGALCYISDSQEKPFYSPHIPKGFISDGATVSRWLVIPSLIMMTIGAVCDWVLFQAIGYCLALTPAMFPRVSNYFSATVIHDFLLSRGQCSRYEADALFHKALLAQGVRPWRAYLMYCGVRFFSVVFRFKIR
jgi:hypothetical protein